MKKLVAAFAAGIMIAGTGMTNVSAEEYQVEKGDSLWDIAKEFNTSVDDLVDINSLKTTVIQPKQTLFINETYKVEMGDTLIEIGDNFDVKVDDIKEWNKLESDLIVIGQELEIKGVNIDQDNQPAKAKDTNASVETEAKTAKKAEPKTESVKVEKSNNEEDNSSEGQTVSVSATAYTADCAGCSGITSTGIDLNANPNAKVIAVDPNVIPLGSEVYVEGYGYAVAGDIGGAIQGNKIDIHVGTKDEAYAWGVRTVNVTILD